MTFGIDGFLLNCEDGQEEWPGNIEWIFKTELFYPIVSAKSAWAYNLIILFTSITVYKFIHITNWLNTVYA